LTTNHQLAEVLRRHGHRATGPRQAVYDALAAADGHLTADEVAARVPGAVNIATVYRALAVLEEVDVVRSVRLGDDGSASWELSHPDDHVHLVCTACGDVDHHVGTAVDQLRHHLEDDHGFVATGVELVVSGTCAACRGVADDVLPASRPARP
jgi:Fur family ferric uptake transcriptional regulator